MLSKIHGITWACVVMLLTQGIFFNDAAALQVGLAAIPGALALSAGWYFKDVKSQQDVDVEAYDGKKGDESERDSYQVTGEERP